MINFLNVFGCISKWKDWTWRWAWLISIAFTDQLLSWMRIMLNVFLVEIPWFGTSDVLALFTKIIIHIEWPPKSFEEFGSRVLARKSHKWISIVHIFSLSEILFSISLSIRRTQYDAKHRCQCVHVALTSVLNHIKDGELRFYAWFSFSFSIKNKGATQNFAHDD